MSTAASLAESTRGRALSWRVPSARLATGLAFAILFWVPAQMLVQDWLTNPDAGQGLLLAPIAGYIAWKRGRAAKARPQELLGISMLVVAIVIRYVSGLAVEWFSMRMSMVLALCGLIVFYAGVRQIIHWWLPLSLIVLSVPLPAVVLGSLALPLQFQASRMGAALLEWRHVPVLLSGNVIHLPGRSLFVTEACSGLRSLSALIALGVLTGGMWLRTPIARIFLLALAVPVAIMLNGIRVFLTGFLVYFVDPKLGEGFMHLSEGWVIFVIAFGILGGLAWALGSIESLRRTES